MDAASESATAALDETVVEESQVPTTGAIIAPPVESAIEESQGPANSATIAAPVQSGIEEEHVLTTDTTLALPRQQIQSTIPRYFLSEKLVCSG